MLSVQSLMGWLKAVAFWNMLSAVIHADKFQPARLELNALAPKNMLLILVHLLMFQLFNGWLNAMAP